MDLEALALAVDEHVRVPAAERRSARLYAVRCDADPAETADDLVGVGTDDDDDPEGGGNSGAAVLRLLAEGEARALPRKVRPPAGLRAIALATGAWAAPLEERGPSPSRHPDRRRAHLTVIVGAEDGCDAVDVSVLRYGDGEPTVLRGGIGEIHQRLSRCWSRRPDAPGAGQRPGRAA